MQADSLLRIHLNTHRIRRPNIDGDKAEMTGLLTDNQQRIRVTVNRYNDNACQIIMNRYPSHNPKQMFANYFNPIDTEKNIFNHFFTSATLPTIQQHLIALLTYWTNPSPTERVNTLSRLIRRIPREKLTYSPQDHTLYYRTQQNPKTIYWNDLHEIKSWCPIPILKYVADKREWNKDPHYSIISHLIFQYQWDEHQPLSMHETIQLIRQAQALNIPSLPKDLSEICR